MKDCVEANTFLRIDNIENGSQTDLLLKTEKPIVQCGLINSWWCEEEGLIPFQSLLARSEQNRIDRNLYIYIYLLTCIGQ